MISTVTFSQEKAATVSAGNGGCAVTFDDALTPGESVIVIISYPSTATVTVSPTMVGGGAAVLTQGPVSSAGGLKIEQWYMEQTDFGGETGVTYTLNSAVRANIHASVWDYLLYAAPEATGTGSAAASAAITTASITPVSLSNLVIEAAAFAANDYASGPTNDFIRLTPIGGGAVWQEVAYKIQSRAIAQSTVYALTAAVNSVSIIGAYGGMWTYKVDVEELQVQSYKGTQPTEVRLYASDTFTAEGGEVVISGRLNSPNYQKVLVVVDDNGRLTAEGFTGDNAVYPNNVRNIGLCSTYSLALYRNNRKLAVLYEGLIVPDLVTPTTWDAIARYTEAVG